MAFFQQGRRLVSAILSALGSLPSPALGSGQLGQGDLVVAADGPALYWVNGDGISIPRTLQGIANAPTTAPVNVFVNSATGNDANSGTAGSPVQTIGRAFQITALNPSLAGNTVTLQNVGSFNMLADELIDVPFPIGTAPPLRLVGQKSQTGAFAATGGTAGSFVPVAAGTVTGVFPAGALTKHFATWTSGANTGQRYSILDNSGVSIDADILFSIAPIAGDNFTVETSGSIIVGNKSLSFQGGPIRLDNLTFDIPQDGDSTLHAFGLNFTGCEEVQENAVYYLAHAGGAGSSILTCARTMSGTSQYDATEAACGCIYDGSLTAGAALNIVPSGIQSNYQNPNFDTCTFTARRSLAPAGKMALIGILQLKACGMGFADGAALTVIGALCQNLVSPAPFNGIGPGCFAARLGAIIEISFADITASGAGAIPLISLDQSRGVLASISGANAAASFVLQEKSMSSCAVSSITASAGGVTTAQVGDNAAPTTISGVVAATTDLAAAAPQLCLVGAPT